MKVFATDGFRGGWFIGDFDDTAYRTRDFEVAYKTHHAGDPWPTHYHQLADEINYLISGRMEINGIQLSAPCVFIIERNEISRPVFHTDVSLIVVKTPSVPGDKYEVS
jgi:hypothetical protein